MSLRRFLTEYAAEINSLNLALRICRSRQMSWWSVFKNAFGCRRSAHVFDRNTGNHRSRGGIVRCRSIIVRARAILIFTGTIGREFSHRCWIRLPRRRFTVIKRQTRKAGLRFVSYFRNVRYTCIHARILCNNRTSTGGLPWLLRDRCATRP